VHGLDMRTELRFGEVAAELSQRLGEAPDQLLILGIPGIDSLTGRLAALLTDPSRPVLIIHQPGVERDPHPGAGQHLQGAAPDHPGREHSGAALDQPAGRTA